MLVVLLAGCSSTNDAAEPPLTPGAATCVDQDGDTSQLDLIRVQLNQKANELRVTWALADPIPQVKHPDVLLLASVVSADRKYSYQLGVRFAQGKQVGYFVFGGDRGQVDVKGKAVVEGADVTGVFRMPADLGDNFDWYASTVLGKTTLDACPGEPGSIETQPFTRSNRTLT
ncbi:MAG: hypothetical protein ABI586_12275 [Candidatus Nanopelagicales bacterium]